MAIFRKVQLQGGSSLLVQQAFRKLQQIHGRQVVTNVRTTAANQATARQAAAGNNGENTQGIASVVHASLPLVSFAALIVKMI